MARMRLLARWLGVVFFCTAVFAGGLPVFDRAVPAPQAFASTDGTSSGFKSQAAPEKPAYIGPGMAISGPAFSNALVLSSSLVAWRLPGRETTASSPALHSSRPSPHLRSTPLLI
jgi:hypothetical protein